jgi:hypothetical protein
MTSALDLGDHRLNCRAARIVQAALDNTYRWRFERYPYTLKSGCRLEELQLEEPERPAKAPGHNPRLPAKPKATLHSVHSSGE